MSLIAKLFNKLFFKYVDIMRLTEYQNECRINSFYKNVIAGKGSRFYSESNVFNFRNTPRSIQIGEGTHIRGEILTFAFGGEISIGSNTYIGEGTRIWSAEKILIGNNVLISHNCNIIDTDSHEIDHIQRAEGFRNIVNGGHSIVKGNVETSPIVLGDYVWLSYNVNVLKGVVIGEGAIVGAGSVVTKNVDPFTVVAGNPAVVIRKLK